MTQTNSNVDLTALFGGTDDRIDTVDHEYSQPVSDYDSIPPVTVGGAEVTDAFVDWNLNCANSPEFVVVLDDELSWPELMNSATKVQIQNDPEMYVVHVDGVYVGFERKSCENRGSVQLDMSEDYVDEDGNVSRTDGHTLEGVRTYHHVLKAKLERTLDLDVLSVTTKETYSQSRVLSLSTVEDIVDRYLNGPLGTDCVSYWFDYNENGRGHWSASVSTERSSDTASSGAWSKFVGDRDTYDGWVDCEVEIVEDDIASYRPKRVSDDE